MTPDRAATEPIANEVVTPARVFIRSSSVVPSVVLTRRIMSRASSPVPPSESAVSAAVAETASGPAQVLEAPVVVVADPAPPVEALIAAILDVEQPPEATPPPYHQRGPPRVREPPSDNERESSPESDEPPEEDEDYLPPVGDTRVRLAARPLERAAQRLRLEEPGEFSSCRECSRYQCLKLLTLAETPSPTRAPHGMKRRRSYILVSFKLSSLI